MVQWEVPHSQRDFSLWDSIGGRMEDNSMSERLKSAGIFSGGVEALVFPQYLRKCQTFQRSIKVIRDPWSETDAGPSCIQCSKHVGWLNFKNSFKQALWVEKLQSPMHRVYYQKQLPDKFNQISSLEALAGTKSSDISIGVERTPRISLDSPKFFFLPI